MLIISLPKRSMRAHKYFLKDSIKDVLSPKNVGFQKMDTQPSKDHFDKNTFMYISKTHSHSVHYGLLVKDSGNIYQFLMTSQNKPQPATKLFTHPPGDTLVTLEQAKELNSDYKYLINLKISKKIKEKYNYDISPQSCTPDQVAEHQARFDDFRTSNGKDPVPLFTQYWQARLISRDEVLKSLGNNELSISETPPQVLYSQIGLDYIKPKDQIKDLIKEFGIEGDASDLLKILL